MVDQKLLDSVLAHFEITDFNKQILRYGETYRESFKDKLLSDRELEEAHTDGFYIGHIATGLGEFLSYTPLPRYLKQHYPDCKVFVCKHRFAPALFRHNTFVDDVVEIPNREPIGTFREFGFGTHVQKRLRPFGLFVPGPVRPEITVSLAVREKWRAWRETLPLAGRKLVFVQSSGRTNPKLFSAFSWWRLLRPLRDEFYFVQIGNLRDQFIWAHKVLLSQWDMEEMAAALEQGDAFVGPNSGLMHFAAAVDLSAVIIHNEAKGSEMYFPTLGDNAVLPHPINHHLFHAFPQHHHLVLPKLFDSSSAPGVEALGAAVLRSKLREACIHQNSAWTSIAAAFPLTATLIR